MSIVRALRELTPQRLAQAESMPTERPQPQWQATVQPIASHGGQWPGRGVAISTEDVSLLLSRRFEPGTLLSISLPDGDCMPLARVQRVTPEGVYWRIDCAWSETLSAEELQGYSTRT